MGISIGQVECQVCEKKVTNFFVDGKEFLVAPLTTPELLVKFNVGVGRFCASCAAKILRKAAKELAKRK